MTQQLFNALIKLSPLRWQRVLEDSRIMRSYLNKVLLVITDGLTKELCIGAYLGKLSKSVRSLAAFIVLYI